MTRRRTPVFAAAAAFSAKPPAAPPSFVTSHFAPMARSIAVFISSENGPCIARICAALTPASLQSTSESSSGSTRA